MASPHAAAVIALLLDAAPGLRGDTDLIKAIVQRTSNAVVDLGCGGEADGIPNNRFGWGIVNARRAFESLSQQATLAGRVTESRGQPLADAQVTIYDYKDQAVGSATTNAAGEYDLSLPWGSYRVEGVKAGYRPETVTPIHLVGGEITNQDLSLESELFFVPLILH